MEAHEAAEKVRETLDEEREDRRVEDNFRNRVALVIAVLAALLAIAALGRDKASNDSTAANILASDTWAFYQAKNIRQYDTKLASDALRAQIALNGSTLMPDVRQGLQKTLDDYQAEYDRLESDPKTNEGKKELTEKGRALEAERDLAQRRSPSFDYSVTLYQIGIVLGSVSIVANSRRVLIGCVAFGVLATLLLLNAFLLAVTLP